MHPTVCVELRQGNAHLHMRPSQPFNFRCKQLNFPVVGRHLRSVSFNHHLIKKIFCVLASKAIVVLIQQAIVLQWLNSFVSHLKPSSQSLRRRPEIRKKKYFRRTNFCSGPLRCYAGALRNERNINNYSDKLYLKTKKNCWTRSFWITTQYN